MAKKQYEAVRQMLLRPKQVMDKLNDNSVVSGIPNRPKTILSQLFWKIVHAADIGGIGGWDARMKRYVFNPKNGVKQTPEARTTERGNLTGQLLNPDMSWLSFFKSTRFMEFKRWKLTFEGELPNGKIVKASVEVNSDLQVKAEEEPNSKKEGEA